MDNAACTPTGKRIVRTAVIQLANKAPTEASCDEHRKAMIEAHIPYIEEAGKQGVQMLCFQEIFTGPYFCPSQDTKWYDLAEPIPDGPTTRMMQEYAKNYVVKPFQQEDLLTKMMETMGMGLN